MAAGDIITIAVWPQAELQTEFAFAAAFIWDLGNFL